MTREEIIAADFGAAAPAVAALMHNFRPHVGQPNDVLANFFANTQTPRQEVIDWLLKRHGVPILALATDADGEGIALGEAMVAIDDRGSFEFSDPPHDDDAVRTLIVVVRDESGEPLDLVAWAPRSDRIATYHGRASILGAQQLEEAHLDDPLTVHQSVLVWLQAGRRGVVIIDAARARRLLDGELLGAVDVAHGLELRKVLQPPPQRIVVPSAREAA